MPDAKPRRMDVAKGEAAAGPKEAPVGQAIAANKPVLLDGKKDMDKNAENQKGERVLTKALAELEAG